MSLRSCFRDRNLRRKLSRALPAERVSPFQTEIWSRPWAHSHGLTLTTMSLHTMSVIFSGHGGRPHDRMQRTRQQDHSSLHHL